jgi:hypothetical protein
LPATSSTTGSCEFRTNISWLQETNNLHESPLGGRGNTYISFK